MMRRAIDDQMTAVLGRRWERYVLWYVESCFALAAVFAFATRARPEALVAVAGYLLACGLALVVPANALRLVLRSAGVPSRWRRSALQLALALSAASTAASLANDQGWTGIVCILLIGNSLWAMELEFREEAPD